MPNPGVRCQVYAYNDTLARSHRSNLGWLPRLISLPLLCRASCRVPHFARCLCYSCLVALKFAEFLQSFPDRLAYHPIRFLLRPRLARPRRLPLDLRRQIMREVKTHPPCECLYDVPCTRYWINPLARVSRLIACDVHGTLPPRARCAKRDKQ